MIFFGYLLILATVALLIILSEKVFSKIIGVEYCRKILHIGTLAALPIADVFLGKGSIHFVIICAVFSVVSLILYANNSFKTIDKRQKRYPGIFYYALSLFTLSVICYFYNHLAVYFGVAFISLALGDGFATLMGHALGGLKIYKEKTLTGFISCGAVTFIALLVYSSLNESFLKIEQILLVALLVSIVELIDWGLDNIVIPLAAFFISYQLVNMQISFIALAIFEAVFIIAFFFKVIEYYGALTAALIGFLFYQFGGAYAILFVVGCYAVMLTVSLVSKILKNDVSGVVKKTGKKDITEIFVNGIWSITAIILYAIFKDKVFLVIALASMSEGFVDSLASDVGTLSKRKPYDLIKRQYVPKGLSGGVTLLGSVASFIGALGFSVAIKFICSLPYYLIFVLTVIIYLGSVVDSVLGSILQVKYRCEVCLSLTEKNEHCGKLTKSVSGFKAVTNDTVNALSGFFVFSISFILFLFV